MARLRSRTGAAVSADSKIEWTDATWNPVTGCTKVSPGCDHCYAERITERFHGPGSFAEVKLHPDRLDQPLRWRKPRRVFVNSMSDLFHDAVPDEFIGQVFDVMLRTPQHTYQVLTKRPGRMASFVKMWLGESYAQWIPNLWLGTSVESQKWADVRIPKLLDTPAAVRFLSCEPLLGAVNVRPYFWSGDETGPLVGIDWVIVGGESGPGARPMHPQWARQLRDQCTSAGVPFFFKQWGAWIQSDRPRATHLLHSGYAHDPQGHGTLVTRASATMDYPYGLSSGRDQDLVDRGHAGWVRVRRVGKKAAGRDLDGRTWDEYPQVEAVPA